MAFWWQTRYSSRFLQQRHDGVFKNILFKFHPTSQHSKRNRSGRCFYFLSKRKWYVSLIFWIKTIVLIQIFFRLKKHNLHFQSSVSSRTTQICGYFLFSYIICHMVCYFSKAPSLGFMKLNSIPRNWEKLKNTNSKFTFLKTRLQLHLETHI